VGRDEVAAPFNAAICVRIDRQAGWRLGAWGDSCFAKRHTPAEDFYFCLNIVYTSR